MPLADTLNGALRRLPIWPLYVLGALPPVWWFWLGLSGGLGVEPIKGLEHKVGLLALQMVIIGLAVTPLRRFTGVSLIRFRRALGLIAFYYISVHLAVWLLLDVADVGRVWADIAKRPYITIGMASFLLLLPLALTSNNRAVRRLGARWRQLHKLVYPAAALGAVHFIMLRRTWELEPLLYLGAIALLLVLRLKLPLRTGHRRALS